MDPHNDVPWILQVAEAAGVNDPGRDDYGVPLSAVARHRAGPLEQPGHDGPYAKAAALVHTLGRCRWLERSNLVVAAASASCTSRPPALPSPSRTCSPTRPAPPGDDRCCAGRLAHRHLKRAGGAAGARLVVLAALGQA
jgi:hypothetical protein